MKTIVTATHHDVDGSDAHTQRRVTFDGQLSPRVAELVGYGLLWELGLAPIPELAEVSHEYRDWGTAPSEHAPAALTVDTSICSLDVAATEAIRLARAGHPRVHLLHNDASVRASAADTVESLTQRWQLAAKERQDARAAVRDDGRTRVAHDLRDLGFERASWNYDSEDYAITLRLVDAAALVHAGEFMALVRQAAVRWCLEHWSKLPEALQEALGEKARDIRRTCER